MAFPNLLDDPLYGDHSLLVLRWSDDQLAAIAKCLAPLLPDNLSDQMILAIAAIARSIVAERATSGRRVHYARAKDAYRKPKRYCDGDPRYTWHYLKNGMDALHAAGLIEHVVGKWCRYGKGFQSVAWPTDRLVALVEPVIDVWESRALPRTAETIILRDRADKTEIDYPDTADTVAMRKQVRVINDNLALLELNRQGKKFDVPTGRRIFNGSFDRGGRFYCHGPSFQNMSSDDRRKLTLIIDGKKHPLVEIDYCTLHIAMAYSEAGKRRPRGDQYRIKDFDRGLVKLAVNVLFNAHTNEEALGAIAGELSKARELAAKSGVDSTNLKACRALAKRVVAAICRKHYRITDYVGSDCGARFQRRDSDMAIDVMARIIRKTKRCPLPVHDSFLVADIDADLLQETMIEVAWDHSLLLNLKRYDPDPSPDAPSCLSSPCPDTQLSRFVLRPPHPISSVLSPLTPLLLPSTLSLPIPLLEVTAPDLRGGREPNRLKKKDSAALTSVAYTLGMAVGVAILIPGPPCRGPPCL